MTSKTLELKEYAIKKFNEVKNDKKFKPVKSILLPALLELIDNYGDYMSTQNIDKVFNKLSNEREVEREEAEKLRKDKKKAKADKKAAAAEKGLTVAEYERWLKNEATLKQLRED